MNFLKYTFKKRHLAKIKKFQFTNRTVTLEKRIRPNYVTTVDSGGKELKDC